jgi:hypothetical protein
MADLDVPAYALAHGLSYEAYLEAWRPKLTASLGGLSPEARRYLLYSRYNWERSERVHAAYRPSERLTAALGQIRAPQTWVVLNEDWCMDGAFTLPVFVEAARRCPLVALRVLPRDAHPEVMDRYLTGGARAIPKVVGFDAEGQELFVWGSRPAAAKAFREGLLAEGVEKGEVSKRLVDWYAEGGYAAADADLMALLEGTTG